MHPFGPKNYGIIPPHIEIEPGIWINRNDGTPSVNVHPDRIEIGGADTFWEGGIFKGQPNYKWIGPLKAQPRVVLHGGYWTIHTPTREEAIRLVQNANMKNYLTNPEGKKIFFFGGWTFMQGPVTPPIPKPTLPIPTPTLPIPTPTLPIPTPTLPIPTPTLTPVLPPPLEIPPPGTPLLASPNLPAFHTLAAPGLGLPTLPTPFAPAIVPNQPMTIPNLPANNYQPQDTPNQDDFAITATPENSDYIQAAIETGRQMYPSLEQYIQVAGWISTRYPDKMWDQEHLFNRSNYPSFMRDASPFEIFKVYKGLAARLGMKLIRSIAVMFVEDGIPSPPFMEEYRLTYFGFIRSVNLGTLTPETLRASITPDQAILMEAWRQKILHQTLFVQVNETNTLDDIIGLDDMKQQLLDARFSAATKEYFSSNSHIHFHVGYDKRTLRNVILALNDVLPPYPRFNDENRGGELRHNRISHLITDHVRYEGEDAVDRHGRNRQFKKIPLSKSLPKEYYMMLYNELATRGLIDNTGRPSP